MIEFACRHCGRSMRVPDNAAGRQGTCKSCNETITVPNAPSEIIPAPVRAARVKEQPAIEPLQFPNFAEQSPSFQSTKVSVNINNRSSGSLGISSIILGILGLMICWIPLLGLLGMPLSGLGLILGLVAIVVSSLRRGAGLGFSIAGSAISGLALAIAFASSSPILIPAFQEAQEARRRALLKEKVGPAVEPIREQLAELMAPPKPAVEKKKAPTPPKKDKDWFIAEIPTGSIFQWRKFDSNGFGKDRTHSLRLAIAINTIPDKPIKTYRGRLIISKGEEILFDEDIEETPDVSFTNRDLYFVKIDPYDDDDASHRALRFTDEKELQAKFVPESVVFADGKQQEF